VSQIALMMCVGIPLAANLAIMIFRFTLSNAFEKSTNNNQLSSFWPSLSSIEDASCSYWSSADLPLIAPYCEGDMISVRFLIAWSIVNSYSFTIVLISAIGR